MWQAPTRQLGNRGNTPLLEMHPLPGSSLNVRQDLDYDRKASKSVHAGFRIGCANPALKVVYLGQLDVRGVVEDDVSKEPSKRVEKSN
jgi:hypothetical protein